MAFKCKVDAKAFDKNNDKVNNLDLATGTKMAKDGIAKLKGMEEGIKTPFYILTDYYKQGANKTDNPKEGKPTGHFLGLGVRKDISEFFAKKELKGKGNSARKDDTAMGELYIKTNDKGLKTLHFAPSKDSKLKANQWPKVLKAMKPLFKGMKAVAVLGDQIIEEATDNEETTQEDNNQTPTVNLDALISKANEIKQAIASKKITKDIINTAQKWVEKFKDAVEQATPELKKDAQLINNLVAKVNAKREQGGKGGDSNEAVKQLDDLQKQITSLVQELGGSDGLKKMANIA